jgi:coenzyme A diphosphatase NUDT7
LKFHQLERLKKSFSKIPGINFRSEYINSAVMVLMVLINDEYHFVFEKRGSHIKQGGEVCFPGGQFDEQKDQGYLETAIRETVEELGIAREKIKVIGQMDTLVTPLGPLIEPFAGILDINGFDELKLNRAEVEYVFSVPVSFFEKSSPEKYKLPVKVHPFKVDTGGREILFPARQLGLPERYHKPWGELMYTVLVYRVNNEIIWGITARFIFDLVQRLGVAGYSDI